MTEIAEWPTSLGIRLRNIALRVIAVALVAATIGWFLNGISSSLEGDGRPAGFGRGVLQGILMPMALPNLLVGKDVVIYSCSNMGVRYKLGYTLGVDVCGAVFFGFAYWRVSKWRRKGLN